MKILNVNKKDFLLLPNIVSLLRLFLAIPLYFSVILTPTNDKFNYFSLTIVILIIITDYLDGILARKLNQITELGKILDPLADKVSLFIVTIALYQVEKLPFYMLIALISRDLIIFIGGYFVTKKIKYVLPSNFLGKLTINILSFYFVILIFTDLNPKFFEILSFVFIILSLLVYTYRAIEVYTNKENNQ